MSDVNVCCKINPALCATSYPSHWGYTIHVDYVTECKICVTLSSQKNACIYCTCN